MAQWAETTVADVPWHIASDLVFLSDSIVSPFWLRWVEGIYMCFDVTYHLHFWQNDWGLTCHCGNTGWNRHWIRVGTESQLWRRKFSYRSCQDSNLRSFDHESSALPTSCPSSQLSTYIWTKRRPQLSICTSTKRRPQQTNRFKGKKWINWMQRRTCNRKNLSAALNFTSVCDVMCIQATGRKEKKCWSTL